MQGDESWLGIGHVLDWPITNYINSLPWSGYQTFENESANEKIRAVFDWKFAMREWTLVGQTDMLTEASPSYRTRGTVPSMPSTGRLQCCANFIFRCLVRTAMCGSKPIHSIPTLTSGFNGPLGRGWRCISKPLTSYSRFRFAIQYTALTLVTIAENLPLLLPLT